MRYILLLIFFISNHGFSQIITGNVFDSDTKEPLVYANVTLLKENFGASTDEYGKFLLDITGKKNDSILVSYVGYLSKKFSLNQVKKIDTVFQIELESNAEEIDEVLIEVKKQKYTLPKQVNIKKKMTKYGASVQFGMENCVLVRNNKQEKGKLKKVSFYLTENAMTEFRCYATYYRLKFYEYDVVNKKPGKLLSYYPKMIYPKGNQREKISIELGEHHVLFPENGICVGIETVNPKPKRKINKIHTTYPNLTWTYDDEALTWFNYRGRGWGLNKRQLESKSLFSRTKRNYTNPLLDVVVQYRK